jgi:hypothetical protein
MVHCAAAPLHRIFCGRKILNTVRFRLVASGRCRLCSGMDFAGTEPDVYGAAPDFVCRRCDPRTYERVLRESGTELGVNPPSGSVP